MLETIEQGLQGQDLEMYNKCVAKNPGITQADWKELRASYLKGSPAVKKLYEVAGVIMESQPNAEELDEMRTKGDLN